MERKTTQRIIGILVAVALLVILMPLVFSKSDLSTPQTASLKAPPFPDQPQAQDEHPANGTDTASAQTDITADMANKINGMPVSPVADNAQPSGKEAELQASSQGQASPDSVKGAQSSLTEADLASQTQDFPPTPQSASDGFIAANTQSTDNPTDNPEKIAPINLASAEKTSTVPEASTGTEPPKPFSTDETIEASSKPVSASNESASSESQSKIVIKNGDSNLMEASEEKQSSESKVVNVAKTVSDRQTDVSLAKSTLSKSPSTKSELGKPELAKSESTKSESAKLELAKSEIGKPELAKLELAKAELAKAESAKSESAKSESAKSESAKSESAKSESAKSESAKSTLAEAATDNSSKLNNEDEARVTQKTTSFHHKVLSGLKQPGWVIQMGSFHDKENAHRLSDRLRGAGYKAFMREVKSAHGSVQTRVYIGPESKQIAAVQLSNKVEHEMKVHGLVVMYKPFEL